jgi:hypothetical protein
MVQENPDGWKDILRGRLKLRMPVKHHYRVGFFQIKVVRSCVLLLGTTEQKLIRIAPLLIVLNASMVITWKPRKISQS